MHYRNKDISTLDETYWEKSFAFHTMTRDRDKGQGTGSGQGSTGSHTHVAEYSTCNWAPKFLQPVLQQIVLTGKSMEMLEGLGKLAEHDGKASIDVSGNVNFKSNICFGIFIGLNSFNAMFIVQ